MSRIKKFEQAKRLDWKPDLPDYRDHKFKPRAIDVPKMVDLRALASAIEDQGALGSCTANADAAMLEYLQQKKRADTQASRLFIYYNERAYVGDVNEDNGAYIRDGIKSLAEYGWANERLWPYVVSKFARRPPPSVYRDAAKRKIQEYQRLDGALDSMKQCLARKLPFTFGFTVYSNFMDVRSNGVMGMPKGDVEGGHAVLAVGYDDARRAIIVQNSWGPDWGDAGFFYMPYDYAANPDLCDDFWTISKL